MSYGIFTIVSAKFEQTPEKLVSFDKYTGWERLLGLRSYFKKLDRWILRVEQLYNYVEYAYGFKLPRQLNTEFSVCKIELVVEKENVDELWAEFTSKYRQVETKTHKYEFESGKFMLIHTRTSYIIQTIH